MKKPETESKCPYCSSTELSTKPAAMFPFLKDKVDIYCPNCGYICTGTVVNK